MFKLHAIFLYTIFLFSINCQLSTQIGHGCITDTLFLVDSSGSVRHTFDRYREFLKRLMLQMPISDEGHHAGFTVYSGRLRQFTKWALDQRPQKMENLLKILDSLPHLNGVTATGVALDVITHRELPKRRMGPGIHTNLVVLTDGFSYDPVEIQSANLHSLPDLKTFAVSLDEVRVDSELSKIAGNPENVFIGAGTEGKLLEKLLSCDGNEQMPEQQTEGGIQEPAATISKESGQKSVAQQQEEGYEYQGTEGKEQQQPVGPVKITDFQAAAQTPYTSHPPAYTPPPPPACSTDFMLVLDSSGSLRQRFEKQKEMAAQLIDFLPNAVNQQNVHIGLIKYSGKGKARVKLPIINRLSRPDIKQLISNQQFFGGTTYTNEALQLALEEFSMGSDSEAGTQRMVAVVFTDGMSQEDPTSGAKALQAKNVTVFAVAVQQDKQPINMRELELIAGAPDRVFTDKNFDDLKQRLQNYEKC